MLYVFLSIVWKLQTAERLEDLLADLDGRPRGSSDDEDHGERGANDEEWDLSSFDSVYSEDLDGAEKEVKAEEPKAAAAEGDKAAEGETKEEGKEVATTTTTGRSCFY